MMSYIICQEELRIYYYVQSNQMTSLREIFAYNLKEKRQNCGFSQATLAEMVSVSTHHIATIETARNYPTLDLVERMAKALNIEIYELFINPLSPPEEMERLYQVAAKNIDQLISESMERLCQKTAKNIEQAVGEAVEKALNFKINNKK
jgi:transcriptional regulator with XRE-family HTH domain